MKADTSKLPVEIRTPHRNEYLAVEAFYRTRNYTAPIADDDYVLAVFWGNVVVGAVRLCNEGETLVLRGMQVSDSWQGRGIGSSMLRVLDEKIGERKCWCIAYGKSDIDLERFYICIGFSRVDPSGAPEFLQDRLRSYLQSGEFFIMMRNESGSHALD